MEVLFGVVPEFFKKLQPFINDILRDPELASVEVAVNCQALSPAEAIGSPGRDDFPLQKGKEKLMQAEIDGCSGQAYTDMAGKFFRFFARSFNSPSDKQLLPSGNHRRAKCRLPQNKASNLYPSLPGSRPGGVQRKTLGDFRGKIWNPAYCRDWSAAGHGGTIGPPF